MGGLSDIRVLYFSPLNASRRQSPLPYFHPWRRNPPNCFPYAHLDLEMSRKPPPPCLLMRLQGPRICSLLLFCKPLIILVFFLNPAICFNSYLIWQTWFGYAQIFLILVTDNTSLGVTLRLLPWFLGESNMQGVVVKGCKQYRQFS